MYKSWFVIVVLLLVDQFTKVVARIVFPKIPEDTALWFQFQLTENEGMAFSLPIPQFFLIFFGVGVVIFLGWMILRQKFSSWEMVAAVFIFAGALGNIIDRIFLRAVTDFIRLGHFPIFNFADIFITAGVALFLWYEWRKK